MLVVPAAAVLATLVNVFNLWLAARIVKVSGRLRRPWPDLAELQLPVLRPRRILAAAIVGAFLPGLVGLLASVLAASVLMAYAIHGFAVLHAITRGLASRGFILGTVYAAIVLSSWLVGWLLLLVGLIGITDTLFDLRGRVATAAGRRRPAHP